MALALAPALAAAGETEATLDKSAFTILSPTPRTLLRELTADRPDDTESPYTVDAGHIQVEVDFTAQSFAREHELGVLEMSSRLGLLSWLDFHFVLDSYRPAEDRMSTGGSGDITLRFKANLVGNDGHRFAVALMPFVSLPSGADGLVGDGGVSGGLAVPFAFELPAGFHAGLELQGQLLRGSMSTHFGGAAGASLGHSLVGGFSGFAGVVVGMNGTDQGEVDLGWNAGLAHALGKDFQLDAGVRVSPPHGGEGVAPFVGLAYRR